MSVGNTDMYCKALQLVSCVHLRSDTSEAATDWYSSPARHIVKPAHSRSAFAEGGTLSYSLGRQSVIVGEEVGVLVGMAVGAMVGAAVANVQR